jgi:hypothetical protein
MWDGRNIDGAVLLHGEPPFGDSIQFVRYARLVAERCKSVIFECAPELKALLQSVEGVAQVIALGETVPPFAAHAPLSILPRLFDTTLENVPWRGPYIHPDPARADQWRGVLGLRGPRRIKVGVVWTGNPNHPGNLDRSIPPERLAPLTQVPGIEFYSLQKGRDAEAQRAAAALHFVDLTDRMRDFSDTAAFISQLDLVISVDTAVAHLAGAMGARVWVLLNRIPEWRYHLHRSDNPWYPTMRLYRQSRDGDWETVIEHVATDLRGLAA